MNIIPITPETVDLITVLNGGIKPSVEPDPETGTLFYVWTGSTVPTEIATIDRVIGLFPGATVIEIRYIPSK